MQGEALFDIRKRPSPIEKGVPLILEYDYLYSCFALLCKLMAVFTPLSIRRGDGGEASSLILITIPYISKACILCYKKNIVNLQRTILLYHVRTYRHP